MSGSTEGGGIMRRSPWLLRTAVIAAACSHQPARPARPFGLDSSIPRLHDTGDTTISIASDTKVSPRSTETIWTLAWTSGCQSCPLAVRMEYRVLAGGGHIEDAGDNEPGRYLANWTFGDSGEQVVAVRATQPGSGLWVEDTVQVWVR